MLPLTRSRNRARFFGIPFSPSKLFSAGEQGFFYDPSDYSTLFQDAAGTTPVTAVEQPVGLMLDKSKGLVLGPELITGSWTAANGTATGTPSTVSFVKNASAGAGIAIHQIATTPGRMLRLSARYSAGSNTALDMGIGFSNNSDGSSAYFTSLGFALNATREVIVNPTASTTYFFVRVNSMSALGTFSADNISVRELPGNHATSTGAARPTLSARVNLLTKTEQFNDGAWTKVRTTVSANAAVAPDGTLTADKIIATSASGSHYVNQGGVLGSVAVRVLAKAAEYSVLQIAAGATADQFANFDLAGGVLGSVGSDATNTSITAVGNGWYLCQCSFALTSAIGAIFGIAPLTTSGWLPSFVGDDASGIYLWGADLRVANDGVGIPAYQRVNTATDYDSSGFPLYLRFGGTQAMSTGSIDFTATDKMSVFAGVRKLSDAASGILAELSANWNLNDGTFISVAPDATGALGDYVAASRGTSGSNPNQFAVSAITLAPVTNVVTATHDIPGNLSAIRLNGAASGTNGTGNKGTGNFGNYPLYIGARNLASIFFNGRIYSLIGVGSAVSAGNISATESWVNGRTKAF